VSNSEPVLDSSDGPARSLLERIAMPVFKLGLLVFLALGVVLVLTQAVGVVVGDGALVEGVVGALGLPMTIAASMTGVLAFVMSYLYRWSGGED
jgi:hypothetical protein